MADVKPATIMVEALQPHSYNGTEYEIGDTYDIAADLAESVAIQGKAVRTDRVAHAKALKSTAKGKLQPVKAKARKGKK